MAVKLLTEHHFEYLSLKGACTGLFESTLVKMPHCWKSRVTAHFTIRLAVLKSVSSEFFIDHIESLFGKQCRLRSAQDPRCFHTDDE